MAHTKLYEVLVRAARSGDVRRAAAELLFTLGMIAAQEFVGRRGKKSR